MHKKRIDARESDMIGFKLPNWVEVLKRDYKEWDEEVIRIDTAKYNIEECKKYLIESINNRIEELS